MNTLTHCQDHILTVNIWLVWSRTSYSGDERRCHGCGTNEQPNIEDRKIELLSQWKLEAESRNKVPFSDFFVFCRAAENKVSFSDFLLLAGRQKIKFFAGWGKIKFFSGRGRGGGSEKQLALHPHHSQPAKVSSLFNNIKTIINKRATRYIHWNF